MNIKAIWTFRILFILSIIYHIWSYTRVKFDAFAIIKLPSLALTIIATTINYLIQIGLPLLFLYLGFPRRDNLAGRIKTKESPNIFYPKSFLK